MRYPISAVLVLIPLVLAGCQPLYSPYHGDTGYAEVALQKDMYDVSFVGDDGMNETQCKSYALMRAAELALLHGRRWFEIVEATSNTRVVPSEIPPTYMRVHSRGRYFYETVSGGYTVYYDRPQAFVRVHLLEAQKDNALDANQIIQEAQSRDKVEFKELAGRAATQPG